jgi:hypothetical protein
MEEVLTTSGSADAALFAVKLLLACVVIEDVAGQTTELAERRLTVNTTR